MGKQGGHELGVATRQKDLRPTRLLAHVENIGAHPVAVGEMFARNAFVAPQQGLGAAQIDDDVAELDPLDQTVDDLADPALELLVMALALGLAHSLDNHLLGGLRRDAAEVDGWQGLDQKVAQFGVGLAAPRLVQGNLDGFFLDRVGDLQIARQLDGAAFAVDGGADVVFVPVLGPSRFLDRLFHGLQDLVALYPLVARHGLCHLQQLGTCINSFLIHGRHAFQFSVFLRRHR